MKEKIIEILMNDLQGEDGRQTVYCSTCRGNKENKDDERSRCEYCHRKDMGWGISRKYAEEIACEIIAKAIK